MPLEEFLNRMAAWLPKMKGWDSSASARWWATAIKLGLEAKGKIQRVSRKPPQKLVARVNERPLPA